jgi:hypothetical protein
MTAFDVRVLVQRIMVNVCCALGRHAGLERTLCLSVCHLLHIVHNTGHLNLQLNFITELKQMSCVSKITEFRSLVSA